jgi:glucosamine 6-phosphate synthetase-like amidotransferase/phosphosugar isomerase protein
MCGVFGYLARGGRPNLDRLRRLALETEARGRHAFGLAWLDANGGLGCYKRPGPASANLGVLELVRDAVVVVGHCRYATVGDPEENENNHPHRSGRGYIVHNGTVFNHAQLRKRHRLATAGECDSEVLAKLLTKMRGKLLARATAAISQTQGPLAVLGVWDNPARLLVARDGKPLHFGKAGPDLYLASLPFGLPGKVLAVQDGWTGVLAG